MLWDTILARSVRLPRGTSHHAQSLAFSQWLRVVTEKLGAQYDWSRLKESEQAYGWIKSPGFHSLHRKTVCETYRMACPALLVVSRAVLLLLRSVKTAGWAVSPSSLLAPQPHTTASRQRHRLKDA